MAPYRRLMAALSLATVLAASLAQAAPLQTFCNPLDLPYRFGEDLPSRREAADPTVIRWRGEYWLFPSKSGGYWHSRDFAHWQFVVPTGLPLENYAPTVLEIQGRLYWTAAGAGIYATDDPLSGKWTLAGDTPNQGDPDLFRDDDGRVYLYSGCSDNGEISGQELDFRHRFKPLTRWTPLFHSDILGHGAEIASEPFAAPPYRANESWIEGAWMTKHAGKYYLQYAAPGTQFKSYSDGVYVGSHPLGPFTFAPYSPFSFKPTGFADGAGHSSTFQDFSGQYWHIATMSVSVRHPFERRLGLFPVWFTPDGQMACSTYRGDYPQYLPGVARDISQGNSPGWMLLSYRKPATASSTLAGHPIEDAFNEDIRTWWSAKTADPGEWLQVDFGKQCRVNAVQVNFGDEGATQRGRLKDGYGYQLRVSTDSKHWATIVDRSAARRDSPHDYTPLDRPILARYVRLINTHSPGGALFSVSGLRLFGSGLGQAPKRAGGLKIRRDAADGRQALISWQSAASADGYIVRYGTARDRLFSNYQVYDARPLHIHSLNIGVPYFFTVDSFNDTGVTKGITIIGG